MTKITENRDGDRILVRESASAADPITVNLERLYRDAPRVTNNAEILAYSRVYGEGRFEPADDEVDRRALELARSLETDK